jgi:hypothetical protein
MRSNCRIYLSIIYPERIPGPTGTCWFRPRALLGLDGRSGSHCQRSLIPRFGQPPALSVSDRGPKLTRVPAEFHTNFPAFVVSCATSVYFPSLVQISLEVLALVRQRTYASDLPVYSVWTSCRLVLRRRPVKSLRSVRCDFEDVPAVLEQALWETSDERVPKSNFRTELSPAA